MRSEIDTLPEDTAALKAMVLGLQAEVAGMVAANRAREALVQALKVTIARLKKQRLRREPGEDRTRDRAAGARTREPRGCPRRRRPDARGGRPRDRRRHRRRDRGAGCGPAAAASRAKPRIAEDAPRETIVLDPGQRCPDCGGVLRLVGENGATVAPLVRATVANEILDFIAAKLKVVEVHRPKKSCRDCERMVQTPAPPRPIPRGMASPALLAVRHRARTDGATMAHPGRQVRRSPAALQAGRDLRAHGRRHPPLDADLLVRPGRRDPATAGRPDPRRDGGVGPHADDTPIPVLDPRKKRVEGLARGVKEGRIWVYVRDDRPWAGSDPPAAAYWFAPDHKGEHPREHLADFHGILQADAYKGYRALYEPGPDGVARVREAACWAHLRRDFHDVWKATDSPIAREALERIGALYDVEAAISGQPRDIRHAVRQKRSRPKVEAFGQWCERQLTLIPGKGDLAKAMRYALNRWNRVVSPVVV